MKRFLLPLLILLFCLSSCHKEKEILFDDSEPLALVPDVSWALVISPYAAFRTDADWESEVKGHCRKSDIYAIKGRAIKDEEVWYKFDEGWLPENSLTVYTNRFKAETAKGSLK